MDVICYGHHFERPSLMGAMMCIGVATANSILVVTFANDERSLLDSARKPAPPPAMRACDQF